jgi:hypothetical protein
MSASLQGRYPGSRVPRVAISREECDLALVRRSPPAALNRCSGEGGCGLRGPLTYVNANEGATSRQPPHSAHPYGGRGRPRCPQFAHRPKQFPMLWYHSQYLRTACGRVLKGCNFLLVAISYWFGAPAFTRRCAKCVRRPGKLRCPRYNGTGNAGARNTDGPPMAMNGHIVSAVPLFTGTHLFCRAFVGSCRTPGL